MRVLMCPWTFPQVKWEINPFMHCNTQPDPERARLEWIMLMEAYLQLGIEVHLIPPVRNLHDMVYTANAGWGRKNVFVVSRFRHKERREESLFYHKWLTQHGFGVLTTSHFFEGQGDLITTNLAYLLGYGARSEWGVLDELQNIFHFGKPIIPLQLIDPAFYHLDTCLFSWKPENLIMYYPDAFTKEGINKLNELPFIKIEVTREEALSFVCNSVYCGKTALIGGASQRLLDIFRKQKMRVFEIKNLGELTSLFEKDGTVHKQLSTVISLPLPTELLKGGGSYRCCSLFLD